jgi:hypothetical protein
VRMKVLIGVDPHKATVALAAVDEVGELIECVSFLHNRTGLRTLERWAKRFPERRWAVENAGGLGVGTWPRGWRRPASRWWTCHPSFQHGCGCSLASLATPARTMDWTPSPPHWPPGATSGCLRSIPRPNRKCYVCFPKDERTWWPSVLGLSTGSTEFCGTSLLAEYLGHSRPTELPASCAAYGRRAPQPASVGGWLRRSCATCGHWSERSQT